MTSSSDQHGRTHQQPWQEPVVTHNRVALLLNPDDALGIEELEQNREVLIAGERFIR